MLAMVVMPRSPGWLWSDERIFRRVVDAFRSTEDMEEIDAFGVMPCRRLMRFQGLLLGRRSRRHRIVRQSHRDLQHPSDPKCPIESRRAMAAGLPQFSRLTPPTEKARGVSCGGSAASNAETVAVGHEFARGGEREVEQSLRTETRTARGGGVQLHDIGVRLAISANEVVDFLDVATQPIRATGCIANGSSTSDVAMEK